jgi:hypothetical protein
VGALRQLVLAGEVGSHVPVSLSHRRCRVLERTPPRARPPDHMPTGSGRSSRGRRCWWRRAGRWRRGRRRWSGRPLVPPTSTPHPDYRTYVRQRLVGTRTAPSRRDNPAPTPTLGLDITECGDTAPRAFSVLVARATTAGQRARIPRIFRAIARTKVATERSDRLEAAGGQLRAMCAGLDQIEFCRCVLAEHASTLSIPGLAAAGAACRDRQRFICREFADRSAVGCRLPRRGLAVRSVDRGRVNVPLLRERGDRRAVVPQLHE